MSPFKFNFQDVCKFNSATTTQKLFGAGFKYKKVFAFFFFRMEIPSRSAHSFNGPNSVNKPLELICLT